MTINHLDESFVWKSLEASCVSVAEVRMRIFNTSVSSTKAEMKTRRKTALLLNDGGKERHNRYRVVFLCVFISMNDGGKERQEDNPIFAVFLYHHRSIVSQVFARIFIPAFFLYCLQVHPT